MATIPATYLPTNNSSSTGQAWPNLQNGDDGQSLAFSHYADKSIQVFGTFGVGGTLRFEGSNDGVNWAPLTDPQGNTLDFTSAKVKLVSEATAFFRPRVTGGDGTTALTAVLFMKGL